MVVSQHFVQRGCYNRSKTRQVKLCSKWKLEKRYEHGGITQELCSYRPVGGVSKPASQPASKQASQSANKPVSQYASYHFFVVIISFSLFLYHISELSARFILHTCIVFSIMSDAVYMHETRPPVSPVYVWQALFFLNMLPIVSGHSNNFLTSEKKRIIYTKTSMPHICLCGFECKMKTKILASHCLCMHHIIFRCHYFVVIVSVS